MDVARVQAEVDLDALAHNLAVVRRRAGAGVRVLLVVKADAYGHGAVAVARHASRCGVGGFGVGTSAEALELRESGIGAPLLVLGTVLEDEVAACVRHGVEIGLHGADRLRSLARAAAGAGVEARVHLNVDTGMGRLGAAPERALDVLALAHRTPGIRVAGTMTHVAASRGRLDPAGEAQLDAFDAFLAVARDAGLGLGDVHVANSATLFTADAGGARRGVHDVVRPGLAAYGALPTALPGADDLRPVLALRTRVAFLKDVPRGAPIGYDGVWRAPRATRIATLPVGYADGLPWRLGASAAPAEVLVRGRRAPLVGRVSMDYATIDVGDVPGVETGDAVTLLGRDCGEEIPLSEIAARAGTVPYEVPCGIGPRVRRVVRGARPLEVPAQSPARGLDAPADEPRTGAGWTRPAR